MKHYIDKDNQLHGIGEVGDIDGDQSFLVQDSWTLLTDEEFQAIVNPAPTEDELLAVQVAESKQYLNDTDFKTLSDYEPKAGEDLEAIRAKRKEARDFIRANQ